MNEYHITYYVPSITPKLSGTTIKAESIIDALERFLSLGPYVGQLTSLDFTTHGKVSVGDIKYIIKL